MNYQPIESSPLRHTYPYGKNDMELHFGSKESMQADIADIFNTQPDCRRIVVAVPQDNLDAVATCEDAGMRYVLDVELRDGKEVSLMVIEPSWVANINEEIEGLDLS